MDKEELIELIEPNPVCFFKFSNKKDRLESLQNGNLYMNNLQFFIDLEKTTGIKGMGDKDEASNVMNDVEISLFHLETNELILKAPVRRTRFRINEYLQKPVFCLFSLKADKLEIISENDEEIVARIDFIEEQIESIIKDFGEYVLVLDAFPFVDRVKQVFDKNEYMYSARHITYSDFNVNDKERQKAYMNQDLSLFFQKDKSFEYQSEFRLIILNKNTDNAITESIGDLKDMSVILETRSLFDQSKFKITLKKRYLELQK
jgi:hypothetical protein